MKDRIVLILIVFGAGMFCGFVGIAPGLGTLSSPLNRIAGPMVCGDQKLAIEKDNSAYIQGEQTTLVTAYCVNTDGTKQDVSNELIKVISRLQMITGFISGLIVFALGMSFLVWAARRLNIPFEQLFQATARRNS